MSNQHKRPEATLAEQICHFIVEVNGELFFDMIASEFLVVCCEKSPNQLKKEAKGVSPAQSSGNPLHNVFLGGFVVGDGEFRMYLDHINKRRPIYVMKALRSTTSPNAVPEIYALWETTHGDKGVDPHRGEHWGRCHITALHVKPSTPKKVIDDFNGTYASTLADARDLKRPLGIKVSVDENSWLDPISYIMPSRIIKVDITRLKEKFGEVSTKQQSMIESASLVSVLDGLQMMMGAHIHGEDFVSNMLHGYDPRILTQTRASHNPPRLHDYKSRFTKYNLRQVQDHLLKPAQKAHFGEHFRSVTSAPMATSRQVAPNADSEAFVRSLNNPNIETLEEGELLEFRLPASMVAAAQTSAQVVATTHLNGPTTTSAKRTIDDVDTDGSDEHDSDHSRRPQKQSKSSHNSKAQGSSEKVNSAVDAWLSTTAPLRRVLNGVSLQRSVKRSDSVVHSDASTPSDATDVGANDCNATEDSTRRVKEKQRRHAGGWDSTF